MWRVRSLLTSVGNLWRFAKVVWRFRWYDFSYQEEVIDKMLAICEDNWDNSHYVGASFTKKRIRVVRRYYANYCKALGLEEGDIMQQKFHKEYARLLTRLWD